MRDAIVITALSFLSTACSSSPGPTAAGPPTSSEGAMPTPHAGHTTPHAAATASAVAAPTASATAVLDHNAAYDKAKPIFAKYCAPCHTKNGYGSSEDAMRHFDMSSYPFGGHHSHEVAATVRASVGAAGKPATMPADNPGALQGEELALIVSWTDAFDKATAAKAPAKESHDHGEHAH